MSVHVCPFQVVWAAGGALRDTWRAPVPLEEAWSVCRNLWSRGVSQFSRRFPLLVDYCGAFQNPLCSLESFCSVLSVSLAGSLGCWCPHLLIRRAWKLLGSSFGDYGRRRLSVLCRPVAVRRGCLLIAALTGDAFQFTRHHPTSHCIWCLEQLREVEWTRLHK